ncbi:hypothetical protein EVAR_10094_1 [Eumeta japonica]|uniref:Uncharacterized protein n=1 Tax=Eumeta variegata TaxID=151549 RepID=A0A4C1UBY1_EUMVA|nr:hypothetical protein EVAR_10094_1 [Eumeta japonica]
MVNQSVRLLSLRRLPASRPWARPMPTPFRDFLSQGACARGNHRAVTRRRHLHADQVPSDEDVKPFRLTVRPYDALGDVKGAGAASVARYFVRPKKLKATTGVRDHFTARGPPPPSHFRASICMHYKAVYRFKSVFAVSLRYYTNGFCMLPTEQSLCESLSRFQRLAVFITH